MNTKFPRDLFTFARTGMLAALDGLTLEQINRVPAGFNNNLAWQLGHVIAVDQKYIYERGGHKPRIEAAHIETYGNGTKPERDVTRQELDSFKKLALQTVEWVKEDIASGLFNTYAPYSLRELNVGNIADALQFIVYHEGLHVGAAKDLRRAVMAQQPGAIAA